MTKLNKIVAWSLILFVVMGFRIVNLKWDISKEDPTIWVRLCDNDNPQVENDFTGDDPLTGVSNLTLNQVLQSVIDDYNNVPTSYIRLALYPTDPDNPGSALPGDSTFTRDKAEKRTIDICFGETDPRAGASGGYAMPKSEGRQMVGCEIKAKDSYLDKAKLLTHLLVHEMGHCFALMHPQDGVNAVMSYFSPEDKKYRLQGDDKAGLTYLYPEEASYGNESATLGLTGCEPKNN